MDAGIALDKSSMDSLFKRFDNAPMKIKKNAMRSMGRAGANVVKKAAIAKAPSYLKPTIKVKARRERRSLRVKFSVTAGWGQSLASRNSAIKEVRGAGLMTDHSFMKPASWIEFGTYGNRDYRGQEPYSPVTLASKRYATGRSSSYIWNEPTKWLPARAFMRPAISNHIKEVEIQMARKLSSYLAKKGL